jgi:ATP-binding cassette subfamily F protein 3
MISIRLSNIKLVLGSHTLFEDLSWEIHHQHRIGLIGPNGAGKSSLFKLITGEYTFEPGGAIVKAKGVTLGYLPQHPELDVTRTAYEIALGGNPRVREIELELERIETSLGQPEIYNHANRLARALEEQQRLLDEYNALGGDSYTARVRETLLGLGLPEPDLDKPAGVLSGGQKKLVGLARIMMARPSVLLLDEPDNHLDIPGKMFLERFMLGYPGAVVIISHDRYLLDAVVTHIVELEDGRLAEYKGDYSGYIAEKEKRLARQEELYRIQQREISRLEAAIKRYSLWAKQYDNEDFAARAKAIQGRLDRMDKLDKPILERRKMGLELNGWRGSNKVLELAGLVKSFEAVNQNGQPGNYAVARRSILNGIDLLIRHGERVGLVGANGAGKSVLLRMILGTEQPEAGEIYIGPSVKVGYYAQEHENLDFNQTLIETVRYAGSMSEPHAVSFLIRYLFTYKQASQKIRELSGGERSRLQLALLVLSGANFLLLDEPTNNLDIPSAEVLENALSDFDGTVLVISHDRYFLDRTVDRIVELKSGCLKEYLGGYSDYARQQQVEGAGVF